MAIAIAIKPIPGPGDKPGMDAAPDGGSDVGQSIVDQCKQLGPEAITTLTHGISPEAIEIMEQIPELAPFANYIEHGSTAEESPEAPPGNTGPTKMSARDSVAQAMGQQGIKGSY